MGGRLAPGDCFLPTTTPTYSCILPTKRRVQQKGTTMAKDLTENHQQARVARNQWANMGYVSEQMEIQRLIAAGEEVPENLLHPRRGNTGPQANADNPAAYEAPPRSGKGSGVDNWREFALLTTEMDEDAVANMDRDDIIEVLETRGIIDKVEQ